MEIAFETQRLRRLCENGAIAKRELGPEAAEKLRRRLADLRAAESLLDLLASPAKQLEDSFEVAIHLEMGFHVILRANHLEVPLLDDKSVNWAKVERVKVMEVGHYANL